MSGDGTPGDTTRDDDDRATTIRSHVYLRTAMACLLVALGVSVLYQTLVQDETLGSVSAYYYTPAQTVFVGSLIAFGACLISLRGKNDFEDLFLNLAGIFAIIVAVVPTANEGELRSAQAQCAEVPAVYPGPTDGRDPCETAETLRAAARANIDNNMTALIGVAVLGLIATFVFILLQSRKKGHEAGRTRQQRGQLTAQHQEMAQKTTWWGFAVGVVVVGAIIVTHLGYPDWYADHAHVIAACGLMTCIVVVASYNSRRDDTNSYLYAGTAIAIVVSAAVGISLMFTAGLPLFWVEIVVALLFLAYWLLETVNQLQQFEKAGARRSSSELSGVQA